jgi:hypothetical protein
MNPLQLLVGTAASDRAEEAPRKRILLAGLTKARAVSVPWHGLSALPVFVCTSILLLGRGVLSHPQSYYIGRGPDPSQFMWYLVWWPWAILHGSNPLYTRAVWFPTGYNLAWATSIGAASVALAPVTYIFGPVASYNVLALLAPASSAWAGFLLCHHLTRGWWSSLAGGYVIGFSSYEIGHIAAGHVHLTLFFIPPLLILLALRFLEGTLQPRSFIFFFTCALVAQFLISTEIFATVAVCGTIVLLFGLWLEAARRRRILLLIGMVAASYVTCVIVLSPVLYWVFVSGVPHEPIFPPAMFSADLLGPLIPGPLARFHYLHDVAIAARFTGNVWENGAYMGLPLLTVVAIFCRENWHRASGRLVLWVLITVFALALGPVLHIAGRPFLTMPWALAIHLPLLNNVLPVRMMAFAFIALAIAFAMWLADGSGSHRVRLAAATAVIASILPRPFYDLTTRVQTPAFFARGLYHRYFARDANVLVIPYGRNGASMLWQAQSFMYFRMAGGHLNLVPPDFRRWPIVNTLYSGVPVADSDSQLRAFLAAKHVDAIVVVERKAIWQKLLAPLGKPCLIGGVELYKVPGFSITAAPQLAELEAAVATARFKQLVVATGRYLERGGVVGQIDGASLAHLGLIPSAGWLDSLDLVRAGWPVGLGNGLWLGHGPGGTAEVGLYVSRSAAQSLVRSYGAVALAVYYPYPARFSAISEPADQTTHLLLMSFSSEWVRSLARDNHAQQVASADAAQAVFFEAPLELKTPQGRAEADEQSATGFPQGFFKVPFDYYFKGTNPRRVINPFDPARVRREIGSATLKAGGAWLVSGSSDLVARAEMPQPLRFRIIRVLHADDTGLDHVVALPPQEFRSHRAAYSASSRTWLPAR